MLLNYYTGYFFVIIYMLEQWNSYCYCSVAHSESISESTKSPEQLHNYCQSLKVYYHDVKCINQTVSASLGYCITYEEGEGLLIGYRNVRTFNSRDTTRLSQDISYSLTMFQSSMTTCVDQWTGKAKCVWTVLMGLDLRTHPWGMSAPTAQVIGMECHFTF